jgi:hypothetical protein
MNKEDHYKLDHFSDELYEIMRRANKAVRGEFHEDGVGRFIRIMSDLDILTIRRRENAELMAALEQQKRELDLMAGEQVQPKMHFAEAVVTGAGGGQ